MTETFALTPTPFKKDDLPTSKKAIVKAGEVTSHNVLEKWKKGKCYKFKKSEEQLDDKEIEVQTYSTGKGDDFWMSRISKHKINKETYVKLVRYLNGSEIDPETKKWVMKDRTFRTKMEIEYIEVLTKFDIMDVTESGWILVNLEYELGKPLKTREFNQWVYPVEPYTSKTSGLETSMIITLVADVPLKEGAHTRAYYASVEKLEYDYEKENLTWTMCTSCDAGGNVPKWVQNATIAKTVAKDVPYLFDYITKKDKA